MNNTPQLRFPGFTGEWSEKELGKICTVNRGVRVTRSELPSDGIYPVYQNTNSPMGFHNNYNVKSQNPFVIIGGSAGLIGFSKSEFWAADDCVFFGDNEDLDKYFLYSTLLNRSVEIKDNVRGGNVPRLDRRVLENLKVAIPSPKEQQKIADCLSALDDLISAQGEKVDALKTRKKGLMQQLFPQNGETTPRLRFPGFTGEWSIRKVSEIFKITRGYVLPAAETKEVPDEVYRYPVYSSQTAKNGLMGYYSKALYKDAITWTTDGANAGTVRYRDGEFYCTNVCGVLISTSGFANNCIAEILNTVSKNYVSYVGNPKLMNNVMSEIAICIPPTIKEQQKIAECLSALDDLIASESAELEALKAHKKGLMQQLFPEPAK